jgi:hypothetical protein
MGKTGEFQMRQIDISEILKGTSLFLVLLLASSFFLPTTTNPFVDGLTVCLAIILCLQSYIVIKLNDVKNDPFVVLLAGYSLVLFAFRILSLSVTLNSTTLSRFSYSPSDSNFALFFIIIANLVIYIALFLQPYKKVNLTSSALSMPKYINSKLLFLLVLILGISSYSFFTGCDRNSNMFISYLRLIFSPENFFFYSLIFLIHHRNFSFVIKIVISIIVILFLLLSILNGSRSGLYNLLFFIMLFAFSFEKTKISLKLFGALVMIILPLLLFFFAYGSAYRDAHNRSCNFVNNPSIVAKPFVRGNDIANHSGFYSKFLQGTLRYRINSLANRIGYFDFSADIITNRKEYEPIFNLKTYSKSFVDNIFTPGFDIYNQPRISNSLVFIYSSYGIPSKEVVASGLLYQADQIGIYGEAYALFGWFSLPFFFLFASCFKYLYRSVSYKNSFEVIAKRMTILALFLGLIGSFGFDWYCISILVMLINLYFFIFIYGYKNNRRHVIG